MPLMVGQGVLGRVRFKDGQMPQYDRTYLIVAIDADYIKVLNVSTIKGKERKLAFPYNERLRVYCPPFRYPSFVKLDSLTKVPLKECGGLKVLHGGEPLDATELNRILQFLS